MGTPLIARCVVTIAVASAFTLGPACAKQLTICGEKLEYEPVSADAQTQSLGRDLAGIWMGDLIAHNNAYSVDYQRCIAFAIEGVHSNGKVIAKFVSGSLAKNITMGTSFGSKPVVRQWNGQLSGTTLRFESKNTVYELQLTQPTKMQGRYSGSVDTGRAWLTKQ